MQELGMNVSQEERDEAFRRAREASEKLDEAARDLGFVDVHELGDAARENDSELGHDLREGIKAITNAHSYLNNGSLNGFVRPEDSIYETEF